MNSDFQPAPKPAKSSPSNSQDANTKTSAPSDFQTPAEVAAADDLAVSEEIVSPTKHKPELAAAPGWRQKLRLNWPPGRKEYIVAAVAVLILLSGGLLIATHHSPKPVATATVTKPKTKLAPKSTTVASNLTGLQVDPSVNNRPVTGVMVENSLDARPQSGLSQAGVVFEAIAEGGITRFLALYQDNTPADVGPIRSSRPYYLQWALGFDAGYAHVGGSPEALADIKAWNVRDLDQFYNAGSYHRISSRAAPHNVYTGINTLLQLEAAKGFTSSKYTGFARKAKEQPSKQPNAQKIDMSISGPLYSVHYDYVAGTNSYNRSEGGATHVDASGGVPLSPKVVIALVMPYSLEADGYHSDYNTIGSGPAYIFQDGTVISGQWSKPGPASQFDFKDAAGKQIKLDPGQTWLTALSDSGKLSYSL